MAIDWTLHCGVSISLAVTWAITILLIINLILWATLFQFFQLFIASNILLGVGLITIGLAIFFLEWRYPGGFFGFAAQHPLLLTLLILWALILIALMLPTWIFVGRFFALDESDLKTYRIGSVSDTTANLFFRSPDMARGLVQGATFSLLPLTGRRANTWHSTYIDLHGINNLTSCLHSKNKRSCLEEQLDDFNRFKRSTFLADTDTGLSHDLAFIPTADGTLNVKIRGLSPSTTYRFALELYSTPPIVFTGSFSTMAPIGSPTSYLLVFGSCIMRAWGDMAAFTHIRRLRPDAFLFLGDLIYIEHPIYGGRDLHDYTLRYRKVFADRNWRSVTQHTPTFFMYDDHEFKNDVALESDPELDGLIAWISYAGGANPQPLTVGAQYYNFTIGNTAYFVLDTRAFRSPKNQKDSPRKTMLGLTQKQKLFQWLQDTKGQFVFRFIVSSVSWSAGGSDSWNGYSYERREIISFIQATRQPGIIFLSGDLHYAAAVELAPGLYEFTASPVDAWFVVTQSRTEARRKLFSKDSSRFFGVLRVDTTGSIPLVTAQFYTVHNPDPVFSVTLTTNVGLLN